MPSIILQKPMGWLVSPHTYTIYQSLNLNPIALVAGKTLNFKLTTADNVSIGAWFILADPFHKTLTPPPAAPYLTSHIPSSLKIHPTILFFHGNAGNRAFAARIEHYKPFSSRLGANVLAIDYRGFGDSYGTPTQDGLALDARAAWDWLILNGARAEESRAGAGATRARSV